MFNISSPQLHSQNLQYSYIEETFTEGRKVVSPEIFKIQISCEQPTMEMVVWLSDC